MRGVGYGATNDRLMGHSNDANRRFYLTLLIGRERCTRALAHETFARGQRKEKITTRISVADADVTGGIYRRNPAVGGEEKFYWPTRLSTMEKNGMSC